MAQTSGKSVLATRYARALLDAANDARATAAVAGNVASLNEAIAQDAGFTALFNNPTIDRAALAGSLQAWAKTKGFDSLFGNFLALLTETGRLALLPDILTAFIAAQNRAAGIVAAHVTSAASLSSAQQADVARSLEKNFGNKINITMATDPDLLGGLAIQMDSLLIDASLRGKLARLERDLKHAV